MNLVGIFVLTALIFEFSLYRLSEALNLKSLSATVPDAFKDLFDPQRYARIRDYLRARTRLAGISSTVFLAASLGFWFGRGFGFLDDWVRALDLGPILSGLIYVGAVALGRSIIAAPFHAYSVFVIEDRFGFNRMNLRTFLSDGFKAMVISLLLGAPLLAVVLALFEQAGPYAWLYAWGIAVFTRVGIQFAAPRFILPVFNTFTPLGEGELRAAVFRYTCSIRFSLENVFVMDGSRRSNRSNAFLTGFGKLRRIVLFDTLIRAHTIPEIVAILAHEIGHCRKKHLLKHLALDAVYIGALLFAFGFTIHLPPLFDAFFVGQPSVYAGLVLSALLLRPIEMAWGLLLKRVSRAQERQADRFAVETADDKNALVSALKKLSADNFSNLSPHSLHVALSYFHPPIQERIRAIEEIPTGSSESAGTPNLRRKNGILDLCPTPNE